MLWLVVDFTTVIPCSGVSLPLIFVSCNVFKIVLLELLPTPPSTHTSLLLERLSIGRLLNNGSIFKTALLVFKFLHSGYPKYFVPFHKQSVYNTRKSPDDGVLLEVPHFAISVYKSTKHFVLSFMMLQRSGMICLMMYARPPPPPLLFQRYEPTFALYVFSA